MRTTNRLEALDDMLLGIYGNRNVNYGSKKVIINDDGIKQTLYSPTSIDNTRRLLEVTFNNTDVVFEDYKKGKNFSLNKEKVIDNTVKYFRELGINIPMILNTKERYLLGKRMCNVLLEYMLAGVSKSLVENMEDNDKEDILQLISRNPESSFEIWKALRSISRYDLESQGRVYGGGLKKIEPRELSKVRCEKLSELIVKGGAV